MKRLVSFFGEESDVFLQLNREAKEYAASRGIDYVWSVQKPYDREAVIQELNQSDAGLIDVEPYNEEIFSRMDPRCRLLIRFGVGFDTVDLPAATRYGIAITRTTGANCTGVAEMALLHILAARRQLFINRQVMESGNWEKNIGRELLLKKVGILGFGAVGMALARILRGFDCEVLAYDTYHNEEAAAELNVRFAGLDEIFTSCDAISIHLPYLPQTHHLVNAQRLAQMKQDAVISCTARGNIVDEDALYDALKNGEILGAGLDVFSKEPLPAQSKLLELPNLILTPHVASQTYESLWNIYKKAIDICADFYEGKELGRGDLLNPDYTQNLREG